MNFNNILVGITLLISLITLYTIYNVNNNMDKLLLDTDSDDLDGNAQRLSIIKYTKENNIKLNNLEGMVRQNPLGIKVIIEVLNSMNKLNNANFMELKKTQTHIVNGIDKTKGNFKWLDDRRQTDAEVQHSLLKRIAKGLAVVPRAAF